MYRNEQVAVSDSRLQEAHESAPVLAESFEAWLKSRLKTQYELNLAALDSLGFDETSGLPLLQEIETAIPGNAMHWLGQRAANGYKDRLIIAPSLQQIGLRGTKEKPGIVPRFNSSQNFFGKISLSAYWRSLNDMSPFHDNFATEPFPAAILLDNNFDSSKPANTSDAPIEQAYSHNLNVDDKEELFYEEQLNEAKRGRDLEPITVSEFIAIEAQDRLLGKPREQRLGSTALVHYPKHRKKGGRDGSIVLAPTVFRTGHKMRRLALAERWIEVADENLRRTIRLSLEKQTA